LKKSGGKSRMKIKAMFFTGCCAAIVVSGAPSRCWGDAFYQRYSDGENYYQKEIYDKALNSFIDAQIESPEDARLKYNVANAHYKTRNYDEAIKSYLDAAANAKNVLLEEKAYYNLGNCLYRQGKLPEAVEYYKKALDLDPEDQDAKYNLEFVREEMKRRMNEAKKREEEQQNNKPPQDQSDNQENSEQRHGSKQQEQAPKEKEKKEAASDSSENNNKDQTEQQASGQKEGSKPESQEGKKTVAQGQQMSPDEAERWLKGLPEDQKDILKQQLKNQFSGEYAPEKDW